MSIWKSKLVPTGFPGEFICTLHPEKFEGLTREEMLRLAKCHIDELEPTSLKPVEFSSKNNINYYLQNTNALASNN